MKQILLKPVVTEKYTRLSELPPGRGGKAHDKQYAFLVNIEANKLEIKQAVETNFQVEVNSVRTYVRAGKRVQRMNKNKYVEGKRKRTKRAIVTLAPGQVIDFYTNV